MRIRPEKAPASQWPVAVGMALLVLFVVLTVLVHQRWLVGLDLGVARALQPLDLRPVQELATATGVVMASQIAILYAVAGALLLWRAGLGVWSLAPLGSMPATLLEVVMKLTVDQPGRPLLEFHRGTYYPFVGVDLGGTFPSGHSIRTSFFCSFAAALLWSRGTRTSRAMAVALILAIPLIAFTRLYIGDHWLSDIIGGIMLGSALALLLAPPVARRLRNRA